MGEKSKGTKEASSAAAAVQLQFMKKTSKFHQPVLLYVLGRFFTTAVVEGSGHVFPDMLKKCCTVDFWGQ